MKRTYTYFAGMVALVILTVPVFARAQSDEIKSTRKEVIEAIDRLSAIKDQELSPAERVRREAELKRAALEKILTLSDLETRGLRLRVAGTADIGDAFVPLREDLVTRLDGYGDYFAGMKRVLKNTVALDDIQKLAGQFKDWRDSTYNPETRKAAEFVLSFQNRDALKTADQRLIKIGSDLRRHKVLKSKIEIWQSTLMRAAQNLKQAHQLNDQALEILAGYIPRQIEEEITPAQTMSTADADEQPAAGDGLPITEPAPTISDLIEGSVAKIREAYAGFIELATLGQRTK